MFNNTELDMYRLRCVSIYILMIDCIWIIDN